MKQKITLTLDDKLIEEIKIQGVREKRSVSEITEEMLREYLNRLNSRAKKIK
jgi:metal-responsive CopG/Arc/MetJ family transcriptional regulator